MGQSTATGAASDPIVCYCFNRTSKQLRDAHARLGSLPEVQKETRAGTKCGGCRMILESMFDENPDEILSLGQGGRNVCVRPGSTLMKGFVAADHRLDTVVYSSNGVPPQFDGQDMSLPLEYMLLDSSGNPVLHRTARLESNETFCFDTRKENLPRPLYGMFLLRLGRANYGAGRFNTVWTNGVSACTTHEINDSGRPCSVLPVPVDDAFLRGPNSIFLAMQNPHDWPIRLRLEAVDANGAVLACLHRELPPRNSQWLNVLKEVFRPLLAEHAGARLTLRIQSEPRRMDMAATLYFFLHNLETDIWSANHL
ncbi:MAG: (2Fe-2S)-binding protein [Fibrobacteria bacterium]